jgi:hypothetical protein
VGSVGSKPAAVSGVAQIRAQIDRDRAAPAAGRGVVPGQHPFLEGEQLRQVQLEQSHAGRPGQPERAGVQAGGEQHDLADTDGARGEQVIVVEPDTDGQELTGPGRAGARLRHSGLDRRLDERRGEPIVEKPVSVLALHGT